MDSFIVLGLALFSAGVLIPGFLTGEALCFGYLWSLGLTVDHLTQVLPKSQAKRRLVSCFQAILSTVRLVLTAYLLVKFGGGNILQLTVVISGFLSYKIVLILEYLNQILSGLFIGRNQAINIAVNIEGTGTR